MNPNVDQRDAALQQANKTRQARAQLKRAVFQGSQSLPDIIDPDVTTDFDDCAEQMQIPDLLQSAKHVGPVRCKGIMESWLRLPERPLSVLSRYRRVQLAEELRGRKL